MAADRPRKKLMLLLKILVVLAVLAAAAVFAVVWAYQNWGIYEFDRSRAEPAEFGFTNVRVAKFRSEDGHEATAWIAPPRDDGQPVLLAFHGNFASVGPSLQRLRPLLDQGLGAAMLVYRGSADDVGEPGEEAFARDARALYDQLDTLLGTVVPANRRVLHGFSLGSSVAAGLAAERPVAGLVLEATFDRCCRWYTKRMRGLPMCALMWRERHDVVDKLANVTVPMLFLHGALDDAIRIEWSRALFDAVRGEKRFVPFERGGHADLAEHGALDEVAKFVATLHR